MMLRNLLVLSLLWLLAGCGSLGSIPPMKEPSSNNNNPINNDTEAGIAFINHRYIGLLDIIERMRVYTDEEAHIPLPDLSRMTPSEQEAWLGQLRSTNRTQTEFIDELYKATLSLLKGKETIDGYLSFLLISRYTYLVNRDKLVKRYLNVIYDKPAQIVPTSKALFDFVSQDSCTYRHQVFNERVRLYAVTRFELLNLLIRESFRLCSLEELTPKTIQLLRAGIQLHPILKGERKDLGHPDEAGGAYAILEPILFPSKNMCGALPNLLKACHTLKRSLGIVEKEGRNNLSLLRMLVLEIKTTEQQEKDSNTDRPGIITQELLYIKKDLDLSVYQAHLVRQEKAIQLMNLGTPRGPKGSIHIEATDYEVGKWPYELPDPDFLRKLEQAAKEVYEEESIKSIEPLSNQEFIEPNKTSKQEKLDQESLKPIIPSSKQEKEVTIQESKQEEVEEEESIQQPSLSFSQQEEIIKEGKQEETTNIQIDNNPHDSNLLINRLSYHGTRLFHDKAVGSSYPVSRLSNKHQAIVDRFFDLKQQCQVTFREFRTVWEANGGTIYSGSGSHRALYDSTGKRISYGIFAHGDNQTYGKDFVRYIQEALLHIGLRPSQWMEEPSK